MPDLLLDALPVIDLLEITANTSEVAQLTQRDQSSVSRIYRQASAKLGLDFSKAPSGEYSAGHNQDLLQLLRRSSQHLRLIDPRELRWMGCPWSPTVLPAATSPQPLPNRGDGAQRLCALVRDRLLDLAVIAGHEVLPARQAAWTGPAELPLDSGSLLALPLVRYPLVLAAQHDHPLHATSAITLQDVADWPLVAAMRGPTSPQAQRLGQRGLRLVSALELETMAGSEGLQALPMGTNLDDLDLLVIRHDLCAEPALIALMQAVVMGYRRSFQHRPDLCWLR